MWDVQLLSYWFSRNPAVFQDYLVNLINNLLGGHCFRSSRTRRITGGKITTFKLGHPVFDGGTRWCMFPWCLCQNDVNLFRLLALQVKSLMRARISMLLKSHLDVVEIASRCCWNRARRLTCFLSAYFFYACSITVVILQAVHYYYCFYINYSSGFSFHSASVTRKDLQFGTWTDVSFQRHYRFRPTTSGSRSG